MNKIVFLLFMLSLTICFSSCKSNETNLTQTSQTTVIFPSENCTKIVYWIKGKGIEITAAKDISNIMNILSSTKLSKYETKEEKAGGLYIDIYYGNDVKRLTMLSDYIVLDGVSYKTNDDLTKLLQPYMDNYFLSNGYEEYVE